MTLLPQDSTACYEVSRASSVVDHANNFKDLEGGVYYSLAANEPFNGVLRDYSVGDTLRASVESLSATSLEYVGYIGPEWVLVSQIFGDEDFLINGRLINGEAIYISSGKVAHSISRSASTTNMLLVEKKRFFDSFNVRNTAIRECLPFELFLRPSDGTAADLRVLFSRLFGELDREPAQSDLPTKYLEKILTTVSDIVGDDGRSDAASMSSATRAYIVDKSCELFAQHFGDESFGIVDLCERLRVSRRTLQYSFETIIGMSPSAYMRSVRLNIARQSIMTKPSESIQGSAMDAGFGHLGRFSKYYLDFFGELPSATVSKARGFAATDGRTAANVA